MSIVCFVSGFNGHLSADENNRARETRSADYAPGKRRDQKASDLDGPEGSDPRAEALGARGKSPRQVQRQRRLLTTAPRDERPEIRGSRRPGMHKLPGNPKGWALCPPLSRLWYTSRVRWVRTSRRDGLRCESIIPEPLQLIPGCVRDGIERCFLRAREPCPRFFSLDTAIS